MDKLTAPLAVPPGLGKAIPDILHAILDPLVGKDTPRAPGETVDLVGNVVPTVKTTWVEEGDEGGDDAEDSFKKPSPAQGAPVTGPTPASFLSQPSLPRGLDGRQVMPDHDTWLTSIIVISTTAEPRTTTITNTTTTPTPSPTP